jgi:hypothetical protein
MSVHLPWATKKHAPVCHIYERGLVQLRHIPSSGAAVTVNDFVHAFIDNCKLLSSDVGSAHSEQRREARLSSRIPASTY